MRQIVIINGGSSYPSHDAYIHDLKTMDIKYDRLRYQKKWKGWIAEHLPDSDVLLPSFPNASNAVYAEWKIYFEKLLPFLKDDVIIIGHSLGAMFIVKYLNDTPLATPLKKLILISGGYDDDSVESLGSFAVESAKNVVLSAEQIHLIHSTDDPVVPFTELAKYQADLPAAITHEFSDRKHFNQPTFPELLEIIKNKS